MPKLGPVSWRELVHKLRILGFDGPFQGGKHPYMVLGNLVLTIPNIHREEISVDLIVRLLRQGGISRQDWLNVE